MIPFRSPHTAVYTRAAFEIEETEHGAESILNVLDIGAADIGPSFVCRVWRTFVDHAEVGCQIRQPDTSLGQRPEVCRVFFPSMIVNNLYMFSGLKSPFYHRVRLLNAVCCWIFDAAQLQDTAWCLRPEETAGVPTLQNYFFSVHPRQLEMSSTELMTVAPSQAAAPPPSIGSIEAASLPPPQHGIEGGDPAESTQAGQVLAPIDGGVAAWRLLGAAFVFETLLWGEIDWLERIASMVPAADKVDSRISTLVWRLPRLLLTDARVCGQPVHIGRGDDCVWVGVPGSAGGHAADPAVPAVPAADDMGRM